MSCKVIGVASIKGGVAKTASAIEVAASLTKLGSKVLVIDLDPQCDLSEAIGVPSKTQYLIEDRERKEAKLEKRQPDPDKLKTVKTILDAMTYKYELAEVIHSTKWFDIIPGDPGLFSSDVIFKDVDDVYVLNDLCEVLKPYYDFIIIDSHPTKNILLNMIYVASDYMLVSSLVDDSSMDGVISLERDLKELRESRQQYSHAQIIGVILSRYRANDSTCTRAMNSLQEVIPLLGENTFFDTVRDSNRISMVRGKKEPVQEFEPYNNAAVDYRRIAKKIKEVCDRA